MHQELPLYIFIRNTIVLCALFFTISAIIIERGRFERGENSIFNKFLLKQNEIRDYNNFDITKSQKSSPAIENSVILTKTDSINQPFYKINFTSNVAENTNFKFVINNKVDL